MPPVRNPSAGELVLEIWKRRTDAARLDDGVPAPLVPSDPGPGERISLDGVRGADAGADTEVGWRSSVWDSGFKARFRFSSASF